MSILNGTERFGGGNPTIVEAPAVDCPECGETVFAEKIGIVSCDSCGSEFHAHNHRGEQCPAVECDDCGEEIAFIQGHRMEVQEWDLYHCYSCGKILAVQLQNEPQPPVRLFETDWIFEEHSLDDVGTKFGGRYWLREVETDREQTAARLLNLEATEADSSFHAYDPNQTDAYLCFTEEYCIGYITWNWDRENPELGQLYILPEFREQGIGSGFVEAWRNDLVGPDMKFNVNNPNANTYRLLRSIGAIEVTNDGLEFPGCDIYGHSIDIPDEWGPER